MLTALLVTLLAILSLQTIVQAQDEAANINSANNAINQAFAQVQKAEKAGGDTSSLLLQLNSAAYLLSEAENSYRVGNTTQAASETSQAISIANSVQSKAADLAKSSSQAGENGFLATISLSVIGIVLVAVGLYYGWRYFKKTYMKKILTYKPEVVNQ